MHEELGIINLKVLSYFNDMKKRKTNISHDIFIKTYLYLSV